METKVERKDVCVVVVRRLNKRFSLEFLYRPSEHSRNYLLFGRETLLGDV